MSEPAATSPSQRLAGVVQHPAPAPEPKGRSKGANFQQDECVLLAQAWLHETEDARVGTNQTSQQFYKGICKYYNEKRGVLPERSEVSLTGKCREMLAAVHVFAYHWYQVLKTKPSGTSREDLERTAHEFYLQNIQAKNGQRRKEDKERREDSKVQLVRPFPFVVACWRVLERAPKFAASQAPLVVNQPQHREEDLSGDGAPDSGSESSPDPRARPFVPRPMGRKKAKLASGQGENIEPLNQLVSIMSEKVKRKDKELELQERQLEMQEKRAMDMKTQSDAVQWFSIDIRALDEDAKAFVMEAREEARSRFWEASKRKRGATLKRGVDHDETMLPADPLSEEE